MNNFQRINSISNAHVGRDFEKIALKHFSQQNIELVKDVSILVGVRETKKGHRFDLGTPDEAMEKVIVECKSHRWTTGGNTPSAKMTVWNEAMYYFYLAPNEYRKVFFILKDVNIKRNETLGEYYIRIYQHLIPENVEILEYDEENGVVRRLI
ncbi:MAG: hypothetical protein ABS951_01615 [Solibacillus sp.]